MLIVVESGSIKAPRKIQIKTLNFLLCKLIYARLLSTFI